MCLGVKSLSLGTSGFPEGSEAPFPSDCCWRKASIQGVPTRIDVSSLKTPSVRETGLLWNLRLEYIIDPVLDTCEHLHRDGRLGIRSAALAMGFILGDPRSNVRSEFKGKKELTRCACRTNLTSWRHPIPHLSQPSITRSLHPSPCHVPYYSPH